MYGSQDDDFYLYRKFAQLTTALLGVEADCSVEFDTDVAQVNATPVRGVNFVFKPGYDAPTHGFYAALEMLELFKETGMVDPSTKDPSIHEFHSAQELKLAPAVRLSQRADVPGVVTLRLEEAPGLAKMAELFAAATRKQFCINTPPGVAEHIGVDRVMAKAGQLLNDSFSTRGRSQER